MKQLEKLVKTYTGRHGFVEYQEAGQLGSEVLGIIDDALAGLEKGKKRKALYVAEAVTEVMRRFLIVPTIVTGRSAVVSLVDLNYWRHLWSLIWMKPCMMNCLIG